MDVCKLILNGKITEVDLNAVPANQRMLAACALDVFRGKGRKIQDVFLLEGAELSTECALVVEMLQDILGKNYKKLIVKGKEHQNYVLTQWVAGWAALKIKERGEAERFYRQAVLLQPDNPKTAWALGEYYFAVRDYSKSIAWYEKSLVLGQERWEFKWIVKYTKVWQILAGTLYRTVFFVLLWFILSIFALQWVWIWFILYGYFMVLHIITFVASWRLGDTGKANLIALRSITLSVFTVFIWLLMK